MEMRVHCSLPRTDCGINTNVVNDSNRSLSAVLCSDTMIALTICTGVSAEISHYLFYITNHLPLLIHFSNASVGFYDLNLSNLLHCHQ